MPSKATPQGGAAKGVVRSTHTLRPGLEHVLPDRERVEMREREIAERMASDPHFREALQWLIFESPELFRGRPGIKPAKGHRAGIEERGEARRGATGRPATSRATFGQLARNFSEAQSVWPHLRMIDLAEMYVRRHRPDLDNDVAKAAARSLSKKIADVLRWSLRETRLNR